MTTTIIQPDAAAGKDTHILNVVPAVNYGGATGFYLGDSSTAENQAYRFLIQVDVSSIPAGEVIDDAVLGLYNNDGGKSADQPVSNTVNLRRILRPWTEDGATWNKYDGTNLWGTAGCGSTSDRVSDPSASLSVSSSPVGGFLEWSGLAADVQGWLDGDPNYGWLITADAAENLGVASSWFCGFRSSDHATVTSHPKLTVTHHTPSG